MGRRIDDHFGNESYLAVRRTDPSMQDFNLPSDLVTFLRGRWELEYPTADCEVGTVMLEWLEDLELSTAEVHIDDDQVFGDDPHFGDAGHYVLPCVSLLLDCEGYLPWGVLCWFPTERQFGTVDSDHGKVVLFGPDIGWSEICRDPARWLSLQWSNTDLGCFQPHGRYPFVAVTSECESLEQTLQAARARLAAVEAKCRRRGLSHETNYAAFIRSEIRAVKSRIEQTASLKLPLGARKTQRATENPEPVGVDSGSVPESFAALLKEQLLVLEELFAKAPVAQREQLQIKMEAVRKQVGELRDK